MKLKAIIMICIFLFTSIHVDKDYVNTNLSKNKLYYSIDKSIDEGKLKKALYNVDNYIKRCDSVEKAINDIDSQTSATSGDYK